MDALLNATVYFSNVGTVGANITVLVDPEEAAEYLTLPAQFFSVEARGLAVFPVFINASVARTAAVTLYFVVHFDISKNLSAALGLPQSVLDAVPLSIRIDESIKEKPEPPVIETKRDVDAGGASSSQEKLPYSRTSALAALALDYPFAAWGASPEPAGRFTAAFAQKFGLSPSRVRILAARAGSTVVELEVLEADGRAGAADEPSAEYVGRSLQAQIDAGIFALGFEFPFLSGSVALPEPETPQPPSSVFAQTTPSPSPVAYEEPAAAPTAAPTAELVPVPVPEPTSPPSSSGGGGGPLDPAPTPSGRPENELAAEVAVVSNPGGPAGTGPGTGAAGQGAGDGNSKRENEFEANGSSGGVNAGAVAGGVIAAVAVVAAVAAATFVVIQRRGVSAAGPDAERGSAVPIIVM
eukprot:tig00020685_g12937.t1